MITIVLVEPHELVRCALKALIDATGDLRVVGECAEAEAAVLLTRELRPQVVLLGVNTSGIGPLEATRRLGRLSPQPRVLAFGGPLEGPYPGCLLEVGAAGYLTKESDPDELVGAIRRVHRGEPYVSVGVAQRLVLGRLDPTRAPLGRLTPRELAVMVLVSQGRNRSEISSALCVSPKTVSTYRTRVLRKLGATSDVELTHLSLRHGLIESATLEAS
ncbi:MAG: response regulator [Ectothiorhodospiraceae bacterium]|nr:response regulator [Ectothiorhodospiraceae bacterium]